jgi:hypothetical protein
MDWCVKFPKEPMLILRPSLRRACGGNRNSAKLLSYLLFCAKGLEVQVDAQLKPCIAICRTQGQMAEEIDNELSARTLRDEAIPCLEDLGYLSTEEKRGDKQYTIYRIYPEAIQKGINQPDQVPDYKSLPYYQNKSVGKNFRTEKTPNGSEIFPNGSEKTPSGRAQGVGKISERENANKGAAQADSNGNGAPPKIREINYKTNKEREVIHSFNENKMISPQEEKPVIPSYLLKAVRKILAQCADTSREQVVDEDIAYVVDVWQDYRTPPLIFKQILEECLANSQGRGIESLVNDVARKAAKTAEQMVCQEAQA